MSVTSSTKGEIIVKNTSIKGPVGPGGSISIVGLKEGLTAIPKCGGVSNWILQSKHTTAGDSTIIVKLVASNDTIKYHSKQTVIKEENDASMVVSPDGKLISYGNSLYTFCNTTGMLTFIEEDTSTLLVYSLAASFSPNSKLLYRIEYYNDPTLATYSETFTFLLTQIDPYAVSPVAT